MVIDETLLKNDEASVYKLRSLYKRFGYSQYKMSKFEEYDLYVRNKDFLISDGVITFNDTSGRLLALKPDVTLSIINNFKDAPGEVQKVYYNENVYRISGSSHNYKEIMQTGLECIGDIGNYEICEVIYLALGSLEIIDSDYVLLISHIGLLSAILDELDIPGEKRREVYELISSKNNDGIDAFCLNEGFGIDTAKVLKVFTENFLDAEDAVLKLSEIAKGDIAKEQIREFENILTVLSKSGYDKKITVDFSVVNGMRYYSGVVFKGYINGIPDSVCSGGQYDKLMRKMKRNSSAIGFAVYLDALERFKITANKYDVDNVLLENGDIAALIAVADELSKDGSSVRICKDIPENIRYRRVIKLTGKELVTVCEND